MDTSSTFDSITIEQLRATRGLKWSLFPDRIGAFVAEMDFGTAPEVTAALHAAVDRPMLGYLPPAVSDEMSGAYARFAAGRYGWPVDPGWVRPVADVMVGLEVAVRHFSEPGSAVVLPTPAYMPFLTAPAALGRELIQVPMARDGERFVYDLDALDAAFAAGGGLLVLCNPHNPVGRVLERAELEAIAEVVERHGARVLADEIHAPLVYDRHRHVPYASLNEVTARHTITATSASKAWNLPGMKCAQLVLSHAADRAVWATVGERYEHGAATLGVIANTAAYTSGGPWLEDVLRYLDGSRLLLADLVAEHLPVVTYTPPEGTYLAWLDCTALDLGERPGAFFADRAGVALTDGSLCGDAGRGSVRYNVATPRPVMVRTLEAMGAAARAG